jgi:hypothetical protein
MIAATPTPDVPTPAGTTFADDWQDDDRRIIFGANRGVTDYDITIWTSATQGADGTLREPSVHVDIKASRGLNSDQARELAATLLECAAELDGWVESSS